MEGKVLRLKNKIVIKKLLIVLLFECFQRNKQNRYIVHFIDIDLAFSL
jgi:hypothetical protein